MANILKNEPHDKNSSNFKCLLKNQDFIEESDLYLDYSIDELFNDLCKVLTKVKYLNEKSLFKAVIFQKATFIFHNFIFLSFKIFKMYDQDSEENEITNNVVQLFKNNLSNSRIHIHPLPVQVF
jgi:hypothetical protein